MKWTEITNENMDEVYNIPPRRLVIARMFEGTMLTDMAMNAPPTISTMAKLGGYYYIELPELKTT